MEQGAVLLTEQKGRGLRQGAVLLTEQKGHGLRQGAVLLTEQEKGCGLRQGRGRAVQRAQPSHSIARALA